MTIIFYKYQFEINGPIGYTAEKTMGFPAAYLNVLDGYYDKKEYDFRAVGLGINILFSIAIALWIWWIYKNFIITDTHLSSILKKNIIIGNKKK